MSIEALIREQIEALKANTAAVLLLEASLVGRAGGNSKPAKEEKPKAGEKAEKAAEAASAKEAQQAIDREQDETSDAEATVEEPATEEQSLTYANLRDLVLLLAKSGKREEIKSTFGKHGIESGKDLLEKPDDPATVKDFKKLAEVYADMKKLEG
jgi:negative regulator of genetic competence, sporulation and motility